MKMSERGEVNAVSPEEAAFTDHYDKLTGALPIVKLLPKFISTRIITFKDQDKILAGETDFEKTERFLKHIRNHFSSGKVYSFYKFLEIVKTHGGQYSYLATDIENTIEQYQRKQQDASKEKENVSQPFQVEGDDDEITNMPPIVGSAMVMCPLRQPSGEENLRSINEQAELTSVPVGEERANVVEERRNVTKEKKIHGSSHPELTDLVEHVCTFVSPKWYNLGLRLGVSVVELDEIESDTQGCGKACRKMFQAWLRDPRKGTWNDVVSALKSRSVSENGVAEKLEELIASYS